MKTIIITLILYTISKKKKIDIISTSDKYGNKNNFWKDFFYVGVSPIPQIDIHEFSSELSHLCGTTSFDSCLRSKPKFLLKTEKDANRTRYGCISFLNKKKKEILILRTLMSFWNRFLKWFFLRKVFYFKIKGINLGKIKHKK